MSFATEDTLQFVRRWLPQPLRVLEVGCGDGDLAASMSRAGYEVVAIDSDANAIANTRARGVDARVATWPDFSDKRFGAILFTRSLHHVEPLPEAVAKASALLPRGGKIVIEDFAPAEMTPRFLEWLGARLATIGKEWEQEPVHPISDIRREVRKHFEIVHETSVPYAYRYFPDERADELYEAELILGEIPLGRRIVGTRG
jgi:2-polyprenyl-3-methyl-5-hydroxy-6-metoxy-1,4-benzoquinol methylase